MEPDDLDRLAHDQFEAENPELSLDVVEAFEGGPRLSPAAARFMSGAMEPHEARLLGFVVEDRYDDG